MHLFHPDYALPATEILFDMAALAERIRPWFAGTELKLSIENIRYKLGTSCLVSYRVSSCEGDTRVHIKAYQYADWDTRKQKFIDDKECVLIDEEFGFALFRFPADSALPGLKNFIADADGFLAKVLFEKFRNETLKRFETLAYKPNRRFTAGLSFASGRKAVLKLHDSSTFNRVNESAAILKKSVMVNTPNRIGRSNRYGSLAYDWVEGSPVDLSTMNVAQGKVLMDGLFEYLGRLQVPLDNSASKFPVENSANGIAAMAVYLGEIYAPIGHESLRISDTLMANMAAHKPATVIHGDFHERQILAGPNGISACDFDNCCLGDPISDLANFVGHLRYRASLDEISSALVTQIDDWSARNLQNQHGASAVDRYHWNCGAALFRLASHSFRSGHSDWVHRTESVVSSVGELIRKIKSTKVAINGATPARKIKQAFRAPLSQETLDSRSDSMRRAIESDLAMGFLTTTFACDQAQHVLRNESSELSAIYGDFQISAITPRRHKPGRRCLIEFQLTTDSGPKFILGKSSAKRLDRRSMSTQSELFKQFGFGLESGDGICVPRPLGYYEPWNMWFQEKVDARPGALFLQSDLLSQVSGRIAQAMAKLHTCDLKPCRTHSVADELVILDSRLAEVRAGIPSMSPRIENIRRRCHAIGSELDSKLLKPIHRDFYQDQVLFSADQTFLVDLDLVSRGHPALDVGNFVGHLAEHGIRYFDDAEHWSDGEGEIIENYLPLMPSVTAADIAAFKVLSLARHIHISWATKDRRATTPKIIEFVEQLLDKVSPSQV